MPRDKEIADIKNVHEPKDAALKLIEIVHSLRFVALFSKSEYKAAIAVIDELSELRRFKRLSLTYAQTFVKEMEKL